MNNVLLNGKTHAINFLQHTDIENGGELHFEMSHLPNKKRGTRDNEILITNVEDKNFIAVPFFEMKTNKFKNTMPEQLKSLDEDAAIFYSVDERIKSRMLLFIRTKGF